VDDTPKRGHAWRVHDESLAGLALPARPEWSRRAVLAVVLLAAFSTNLTLTILTIALAPIALDLGVSIGDVAWVTLAPMVVSAVVTPAAGRIADRWGRKKTWFLGVGVATFGMLASGLAPSLPWLIAARVVTGTGTALVMPSGLAIASSAWSREEQSVPLGYWTSTMAFSPTLGIVLGGFAIEYATWRVLFFAQLPIALVALVMAVSVLPTDVPSTEDARAFDYQGAAVGALGVLAALLWMVRAPQWGFLSLEALLALGVAVVTLAWFWRIEKRAEEPVLPPPIFERQLTRRALLSRSVVQAVYMGSFLITPVLLTRIAGWSPGVVAAALLPRPIAMGIVGPLAGLLIRRSGVSLPTQVGAGLVAAGCAYHAWFTPEMPYLWLALALVAQGAGLALASTATAAAVTSDSAARDLGASSAALGLTTALANAGGMALLLGALEALGGDAVPAAYGGAFALAAGLALAVALLPVRAERP
jgi:EmrB/QacA subfamily drug resistance transporter